MNGPDEHSAKQPSDGGLETEVVENIPVHTESSVQPTPIKDGENMDELMEQVGSELKKDDHKSPKRHWFSKKKRKDANFQASPVQRHHNMAPPAPRPQPHPAAPRPVQARPSAKPQPKTPSKNSAPVMVITITIIVTGILIAAAISAYKK